ncbi:response regulator [Longispora urticae]
MIRVVLADDQPAVRAGLALVLSAAPDIEVVGEAGDGEQAVALATRLAPDVVVMDVRMPVLDGIAATRQLAGIADVLVLTTFDLDEYVFGALRAGAAGFLLKDTDAAGLIGAVRLVARGEGLIDPQVTRTLIAAFGRRAAPPPSTVLDALTAREREVLAGLAGGLSNADLGARLSITEATTKVHVSRVLAKLGLRSRVQAAVLAQEVGVPPLE